MSDFIFYPYLFLRTPALNYNDFDNADLSDIIRTQFFQSAIFFASESLYMELYSKNFDYNKLDEKVKFSLQKYFNRMCYRPTPFGMFSAFSSVRWNAVNDGEMCVLGEADEIHINPDFQFTAELARRMERSGEFFNVKYFPNNTIYARKTEKRYLTGRFDHKRMKTEFFINSFETNRILNGLLNYCQTGKTRTELVLRLSEFVDDEEDAKAYIDDLIQEGLLISELSPNLTGKKYFERLVAIADERKDNSEMAKEVLLFNNFLEKLRNENGKQLTDMANSVLYNRFKKKFKSMFYVAYEKPTASALDKTYQENIREGLNCLTKISTDTTQGALTKFVNRFRSRFEDQEVSLLVALDREAGIGYEGLEANLITSELLDGIQLDLQSNTLNFNWTPVHEFFLSKLVAVTAGSPIVLDDDEMERLQEKEKLKTPPSFSVIFRVCGDKIWIEQAGGCTATALLGRFSLFNKNVHEEVNEIAALEARSNQDVIFAEISCFNDEHAANINVNAGVRKYEIPIGVHSAYPPEHIISLSDLFVSVAGGQIRLRSKKHNKIIIPRLSSAYNYNRSELTVFRFLCDLQYQDLKFNYNFNLRALLPGLNYYPRVEYKKCILYPATWILHQQEIAEITGNRDGKAKFFKISKKIGLKKRFALTEGDNQLIFDQNNTASIELFINTIKNKTLAVLTEVFIDEPSKVVDSKGLQYAGQFIASVFSASETYPVKNALQINNNKNKVKRIYLPGDEWVYFKVYCHPSGSNNILIKEILNSIASLKKQQVVESWFFIRYADPDHHLRVRIRINPDNGARVVRYFEKKIRSLVEKGSVNNLVLDTYKREIERYGEDKIEFAEAIFNVSSELIVNFLKRVRNKQTELSEFHLAVVSIDAMLDIFMIKNSDKIGLLKQMHEGMKREFDDSKQLKIQLDNKYRDYAAFFNGIEKLRPQIVNMAGKKQFENYLEALHRLKAHIQNSPAITVMKLAGDLIHMHVNRLFSDKQRNHEFIIYYLLYKYYVSTEARRSKGILSFSPTFKGLTVNQVEKVVFK